MGELNREGGGLFEILAQGEGFVREGDLKGQGHVTINKPVISIISIVAYTWPSCSEQILADRVNPQES